MQTVLWARYYLTLTDSSRNDASLRGNHFLPLTVVLIQEVAIWTTYSYCNVTALQSTWTRGNREHCFIPRYLRSCGPIVTKRMVGFLLDIREHGKANKPRVKQPLQRYCGIPATRDTVLE